MKLVESSNISHIGYDGGTLTIRFKSGDEWQYNGVPAGVHDEMLKAESIGGFFHRHIRGKYEAKKREDEK